MAKTNLCRWCASPVKSPRLYCNEVHKWNWYRESGAAARFYENSRERRAVYEKKWRAKNRPPKGKRTAPAWNKGLTMDDTRVAANVAKLQAAAAAWRTTPEGKRVMSETATKRVRRGPANNKWKGGVTPEHQRIRTSSPEYKEWRMAVYQRDYYTCRRCGLKGHKPRTLVAHHIKSFADYPDLRFDVDNGLTLCRACHAQEDHQILANLSLGPIAIAARAALPSQ